MAKVAHINLPDGRRLDFTITVSGRRKTIGLKMTPREGLVVTAPRGVNQERIREMVAQKADWIARKMREIEAMRSYIDETASLRPEGLALPALGEWWRVDYLPTSFAGVTARTEEPGRILVSGAVGDAELCQAVLRRWLNARAQRALGPRLAAVARETGIGFEKLAIRNQRTRWGSCSRDKGTISLNSALLFLSPEFVRYVMVHELCHMMEPNHSPRFWSLVEQHVPEYKAIRKTMRQAWQQIPVWAGSLRSC